MAVIDAVLLSIFRRVMETAKLQVLGKQLAPCIVIQLHLGHITSHPAKTYGSCACEAVIDAVLLLV